MDERTAREVLLGHLLGKVGRLHEAVGQLSAEIPDIQVQFAAIADGAGDRLVKAVSEVVTTAETSGKLAGEEAVRKAAQKEVKALVEEVALAMADMRLAADKAAASMRQAADNAAASLTRSVAKVSIWRQVVFCGGAGAVSGAVLLGLLSTFGMGAGRAHAASDATAVSSLSEPELDMLGQGRMISGVWNHLTAKCQAEINTMSPVARAEFEAARTAGKAQ